MKQLLTKLGVSKGNFERYADKTRDSDISVSRCVDSGVIVLDSTDHVKDLYKQKGFDYWDGVNTYRDDIRRHQVFFWDIKNKTYLDVGTGKGCMLDLFKPHTKCSEGVEIQEGARLKVSSDHKCYNSVSSAIDEFYDVVTMFHVFEHLEDPLRVLKEIKTKMSDDGLLIIEVPNARDILLNCPSFKEFTLWSEHLILHTKESLTRFVEVAGFKDIEVEGFQRYGLDNHLGWWKEGKPGGLKTFVKTETDDEYENLLKHIDATDTLILKARK